MDDLERYIQKRSEHNTDFTQTLWNGYDEFKIGVLLKEARNEAGLTQDQVAQMLCTQKTAISRIENHAQDIKLSTLANLAKALGKQLKVELI